MKSRFLTTITYAAILGVAATARADYAVNTFGPGQSFDPYTGLTVSGPGSVLGYYSEADETFTAAAGGVLENVTIAATNVTGTNSVVATLYADDGGTPGVQLESWTTALPLFGSSTPTVLLSQSPAVQLVSGRNYWLDVTPGAGDTWATWNFDPTDTNPAFSVEVTPEPPALAAMAIGLIPLLRRRHRR